MDPATISNCENMLSLTWESVCTLLDTLIEAPNTYQAQCTELVSTLLTCIAKSSVDERSNEVRIDGYSSLVT